MIRHPERVGGLFWRPAGAPFVPLHHWRKGRIQTELLRVDARLNYLATAGPGAQAEAKSLRKYRNRLARALGR